MIRGSIIAGLTAALLASTGAQAAGIKSYFEFKKPKMIAIDGDISNDTNGESLPVLDSASGFTLGFEGISQYDGASFGRNFVPPDTMGAVGGTQYLESSNGSYAVFDKYTGTRLSLTSDVSFWATAGQTGTSGDSRVMYNAAAGRWMVVAFGGNAKDLQIAISDTDNALGTWKSVKFEGYAGLGFGATADYPTLALDRNAVYIGTNNFAPAFSGGANSFRGTTLNVIPLDSLFGAGAPTITNSKQFVTPYAACPPAEDSSCNSDRGFALQGVNSSSSGSTGRVIAASLFDFDSLGYTVNGLSSSSSLGASEGDVVFLGESPFVSPRAARQPSVAIPANQRVVDALDERISSSVYEVGGRIYMVHTVTPDGENYDRVRYLVLDAKTFAIIDEGDIGEGTTFDYYQGSIAVNALGQVVIGYNRSGLDPATGKISFLAQRFNTGVGGKLYKVGDEIFLKESLTDDYHNGSLFGQRAAGRQRWGDYSQVSVDPTDPFGFYVIGEFAREYNLAAFGHPGGSGGSRWGTFIAAVTFVPEPASWAMMIAGFGMIGAAMRRQRRTVTFNA